MKKYVKTILIMMVVAVACLAVYYKIANNLDTKTESQAANKTEIEVLLETDLNNDYPATPWATVNLFSKLSKCLYDQTYTDAQFEQMIEVFRGLMDEELLANNPNSEYEVNLQEEIEQYKGEKKHIMHYLLANRESVTTKTVDGVQYATVQVAYTVKNNTTVQKVVEEFLLREDSSQRWKVLGWRAINKE